MTVETNSGEPQVIKFAEIPAEEIHAPSGMYENDGVTPITNIDALRLIEQGIAKRDGLQGATDVYPSVNGTLSKDAQELATNITRTARANGERAGTGYPVSLMIVRPPKR
jgi:hypothetical protein